MSELISVIMPVYKTSKEMLLRAIKSVQKQTYYNLELIIVDDGSPDVCGKIIDDVALSDPRIVPVHQINLGVGAARNTGINNAKGEYIFFVDSDDELIECALEKLYNAIKIYQADLSMCSCIHNEGGRGDLSVLNDTDEQKILTKEEFSDVLNYMKEIYDEFEVTAVWGKLFKKELLRDIKFNSKMCLAEDYLFNLMYLKKVDRAVCIEGKYYIYNINPDSLVHQKYSKKLISTFEVIKENAEQHIGTQYEKGVLSRTINISLIILLRIPCHKDYELERIEIINFINCHRAKVIMDSNSRKKVKLALILSYLGYDFMQKIFNYFTK